MSFVTEQFMSTYTLNTDIFHTLTNASLQLTYGPWEVEPRKPIQSYLQTHSSEMNYQHFVLFQHQNFDQP